jgi:hypothetical protein
VCYNERPAKTKTPRGKSGVKAGDRYLQFEDYD